MNTDPRDLTTVAGLQAWASLPTPNQEMADQLQRLVTAVSVNILTWLDREIRSIERTETYDGPGGRVLILRATPISAVAEVLVEGVAVPSTAYKFSSFSLVRTDGERWPQGLENIQVRYTAGYTTVPPDLEQACLELASLRWKERDRIGHVSKAIGGETVTFLTKDMPESVATTLRQWRRVVAP